MSIELTMCGPGHLQAPRGLLRELCLYVMGRPTVNVFDGEKVTASPEYLALTDEQRGKYERLARELMCVQPVTVRFSLNLDTGQMRYTIVTGETQ